MTPNFHLSVPDPLQILSSTLPIVTHSHLVSIDESALEQVADQVKSRLTQGLDDPIKGLGITGDTQKDISLILTEDSVNFCFWAEKGNEKWTVEYPEGTYQDGWYALVASFRRALSEGIPILDHEFLSHITLKEVEQIFRSCNSASIPLIKDRLNNMSEVGKVLKNYSGSFVNWLEKTDFDAIKIVQKLAADFPSFLDTVDYQGHKINFYKRAQWGAHSLSYIKDIKIKNLDALAAFADYKLPQILRHFGVFIYAPELAAKIDSYQLIPAGSEEEIEIRASTIWAVELIREKLGDVSTADVDNALWLLSQNLDNPQPYHRTYTIYY